MLELDEFGLQQGFDGHEGVKNGAGNRGVDLHDRESFDGLFSATFAAEGEVGDVDALLAENRSDLADNSGNVEVAAHEEISLKRRFDIDAVELKQTRLLAVNHGGGVMAVAGCRVQSDG